MRETEIIDILDDISSQLDEDVVSSEEIVESLRNKMVDLSVTSLNSKKIFRTDKKSTNFKNKCPWFDIECKKNKSLLNNKRKSFQAALKYQLIFPVEQVNALKSAYFQQRRYYKKILRVKRRIFLENEKLELWKLKGEAPKVFWKKLRNSKEKTSLTFTNNELSNYFSKLLNCDNTTDDSKHDTPSSSLDYEIQDLIDKS